jgi:hypothetical protein
MCCLARSSLTVSCLGTGTEESYITHPVTVEPMQTAILRFLEPVAFWSWIAVTFAIFIGQTFRRTRPIAAPVVLLGKYLWPFLLWVWCVIRLYQVGGWIPVTAGLILGIAGVVPVAFFWFLCTAHWRLFENMTVFLALIWWVSVMLGGWDE